MRFSSTWRRLRGAWQIFAENRLALVGVALIAMFGIMAISHPVLMALVWPKGIYDPMVGHDLELMHPSPPSVKHPLGTDALGRDVLSMLLGPTTPEFVLGLTAAATTATVGTTIGAISAYYYGRGVDTIFMHLANAFLITFRMRRST